MGLETATYITDLVSNNPLGTDSKAQGDNHIRLLKSVLKAQFPNLGSAAVTATAADINLLTGGIFDVIYPVGTIYESTSSANPSTHFSGTTWERYGNGRVTVGQDSGDSSFDSINDTGGVKAVTLATAQMPSHSHTFSGNTSSNGAHTHTDSLPIYTNRSSSSGARLEGTSSSSSAGTWSVVTDSAGSHNHTFSGTTSIKGSGTAHENMPPYCVVYRWKRTA
jgi:microcystin-dependent protein